MFFTNKNLKVILFILILIVVFFLLLLTPIILEKTNLEFKDIIAPYIISISALLASTVAMINLRTNQLNKVLDENRKDISEIYYLMMNLNSIIDKLEVYKKMVYQEMKVDLYQLLSYQKIFLKYEKFLNNRMLIYYATSYETTNTYLILNDIENCLLFISMYNEESLKFKEQLGINSIDYLPKRDLMKSQIDNLIYNTNQLDKILKDISNIIINKQKNLAKQENY
jgi:hypothetical protein